MKRWQVSYEVRQLGAIGVFWTKSDVVEAASSEEATTAFRAKHGAEYEFWFPVSVELASGPHVPQLGENND